MNTILKYSTILTVSILTMVACRDEDAVRFPDIKTGVNARVSLYSDRSYVNLDDLNSAAIAFDIYSVNSDLEEIVYTATFTDADSSTALFPEITAFTVPASQFVSGKATELQISAATLAERFGLPGGIGYLAGGDNITFRASVKLKDGRVFDASNSAPSITGGGSSSFTSQFTVFVGCPSPQDVIVGTYYSIMEYNDGGEPVGDTLEVDLTFVGPEPFRYRVTDHTVGLYVPYGGTKYPATFYDLCGTAILKPATSFGNVVDYVTTDPNFLSPAITINGDDVEFVLNWHEVFNNIHASVRFVKKK